MARSAASRPGRGGLRLAVRGASAVIAFIGYILSPLSWWNDAVVNIPISLAIAGALHALTGLDMRIGFAAAYWFTNVAGLVMVALGGSVAYEGRLTRRSIIVSLATGTAYTIAVVGLLDLLGLGVD
ncbi:hypothetical protein [Stetteria hydrogenophila]